MDSLPAIFFTSFVVALSGALMPGPVLTLTVAEAAKGGWLAGPKIILGHGALELGLLVLLALGLGGFLASGPALKVFCLAGGVTLSAMGILTMTGKGGKSLELADGRGGGRGVFGSAGAGALTSVSNPYWVLWWATVGMGYLALAGRLGPAGIGSFFGGHILADLAWYTMVSALVASGRRAIGGRSYSLLLSVCGASLVLFGAWFVYKAFTAQA